MSPVCLVVTHDGCTCRAVLRRDHNSSWRSSGLSRMRCARLQSNTRAIVRLGWFDNVRVVEDSGSATQSPNSMGTFCQFNAGPSFSLIRFETNGPAIWFKAVGEPNLEKFPLHCTCATHSEVRSVILATRRAWKGWLAPEIEAQTSERPRTSRSGRPQRHLWPGWQIESIGKHVQLLDWAPGT